MTERTTELVDLRGVGRHYEVGDRTVKALDAVDLRIEASEFVAGTVLGVAIGLVTLSWMIAALFANTRPEIAMERSLSGQSIAVALLVGVVAVTITPYLLARRLTRMDVPSTLRVVE